ncbi:Holliday junction branch migration protein RuvA [Fusibacillus kribbianus]|uniref:Holliday junction branch migration complex subunit RuvA n=1 Tax=Fusibacillus kribbianus TaxID=3044208 RepID=A0AAP4BA45_9FIRM|nr:Holliday junction branch migration protein RuvA [Ruminococcus sp. YH-rum2234]MDI9241672.1 Holliday junction branch migration protein RuvA [Ruminococcus sp. YH-rum2234]
MISFIKGRLLELYEEALIVETGGIGYQIQVPLSMLSEVSVGSEIQVYTYLHMGQDSSLRLYGFSCREDLEVFKLLIGVSGIGPKGALGVLSVISPDDLRFAVLSEDAKTIARAPGIGIKTAKKLILELKDKFKLEDAFEIKKGHVASGEDEASGTSIQDRKGEAVQALTALGYSAAEAMKAVNQVSGAEELSVEAILKAALRKMTLF